MKVFVTGATGTIGFAVATAFRRSGHQVWGLARSAEKAALLARAEIHPVPGEIGKPESFAPTAESCSVLVHAAAQYGPAAFAFERSAVHALLAAARKRGPQPKTLIYTSGTWVYGNTDDRLVDETTPVAPPAHVSERPAVERLVLDADGVRAIVLRPGCVYGHQGSLTAMWFAAAQGGGPLTVIGDGKARWPLVHLDDLGGAYVRAAESGLTGIFNVTDRSRATPARDGRRGGPRDRIRRRDRDDAGRRGRGIHGHARGMSRPRPARGLEKGRAAPRVAAPPRRLCRRGRGVLRVLEGPELAAQREIVSSTAGCG